MWRPGDVNVGCLLFVFYLCICEYLCMSMHVFGCPWRPEEGVGSLGAGVASGSEPLDMVLGTELGPS